MGDINRVAPVGGASLGGLPATRVHRQEDQRKHGDHRDDPHAEDVIEIGGVIEESPTPETPPEPSTGLDLTA